jgi:hypothetical protein
MRKLPKIPRTIILTCEVYPDTMSKKISSLFAVRPIDKSVSGPRLLRGWIEVNDEGNDAHRVCFPPDHGPPVPGRVPLVDMLEARMRGRRGCPPGT